MENKTLTLLDGTELPLTNKPILPMFSGLLEQGDDTVMDYFAKVKKIYKCLLRYGEKDLKFQFIHGLNPNNRLEAMRRGLDLPLKELVGKLSKIEKYTDDFHNFKIKVYKNSWETNAGKKVMVRGWLCGEKVSVSLPNIFELGILKSQPRCLNETYTHFLVIDKPEHDLVLGTSWLNGCGFDINYYGHEISRNLGMEEKERCYWRSGIDILPRSLHIFYETSFPKFTEIERDVILTRFSKQNMENTDLSEYYDSSYSDS
nr:2818_t:CDS:2 [Entrophospora candida]